MDWFNALATVAGNLVPGLGPILQVATAAKTLYDMFAPKQSAAQMPAYQPLTYDQAMRRAEAILNPQYQEQLEKALEQVDRANIARGFYGQLPGDVLSRQTAADVERARLAAIASLANQMVGQSQQAGLQAQQLGLQQQQANIANAFNALNALNQEGIQAWRLVSDFVAKGAQDENTRRSGIASNTNTTIMGNPATGRLDQPRPLAYKPPSQVQWAVPGPLNPIKVW